ncbi:MAG: hypothetical protein Tsb005_19610 [Gammaproteobacteria bacterium]
MLGILSVAIWGWQKLHDPNTLPIQAIKIEGNVKHLSHHAIEQAILPYVLSQGFFAVNVAGLRDHLMQLPWVELASVTRVWPNSLLVNITEQQAVAQWLDDSLLNSQGELFSPEKYTFPSGLPKLEGPQGQHQQVLAHYRAMSDMLAPLNLLIEHIVLSARNAWLLKLNNGMTLLLGRIEPMERLQNFIDVYQKVFANTALQAERVDLRYEQGLAVQWKPKARR